MSSDQARPKLTSIVLNYLEAEPGLTDRQLTDRIFGKATHPSQVNQSCRLLASQGIVERKLGDDGKVGNYRSGEKVESFVVRASYDTSGASALADGLSEDQVKRHLVHWLEASGWSVEVAWGKAHGTDVVACRAASKWMIEAKGSGSLQPMRVNYFLSILGETLQRMTDPDAKYSIALPSMAQFRGLWDRLPALAKQRTRISALFVAPSGSVDEVIS
jgi:hypothetical protein